nr:hypothetical protein [Tanacetum cinerariifolium]
PADLKLARENLQTRVKEEDSITNVKNTVFDIGVMDPLSQKVIITMLQGLVSYVLNLDRHYINRVVAFVDYAVHNLKKMGNIDPRDDPTTVEMVNATKDNFDEDDLVKFLLFDAEKPLYEGCPDFTKLSAIAKLLNLKDKYGCSDKLFTELPGLLKKMLPAGNEMVEKTYQAKKVMKLMGSGYKKIHTKDGVNARLNLAELGVKPELFAMQEEDKTTLPPAGYTLTNAKKDIFCETLYNIRVPHGYCSNFTSLVSLKNRKLIGLKLHDYYMLMQEFLPIVIRSIIHPATGYAIIRCMKVIKGHVRTKNRPEGCIAEETIAKETIKFFNEYHKSMETIGIPPDKHETNENEEGKPLRHKQVLKTKNLGKRIAFLENEHSKSFAKWLLKKFERELAISKESVSKTDNIGKKFGMRTPGRCADKS